MKRMGLAWVAGVCLSLGCATSSPQQAPSAAASTAEGTVVAEGAGKEAKTDSGETVICEETQETGSRLKKRVCRTVSQNDAQREQSERTMRDMQRVGAQNHGGSQ